MGNSIIEAQICLKEEQEKLRLKHHGLMVMYHMPRMHTIFAWEYLEPEMTPKNKRKPKLLSRIWKRITGN